MKTSELEGEQLDYWVAVAMGGERKPYQFCANAGSPLDMAWVFPDGATLKAATHFRPSTDWGQAGPISERENIVSFPDGSGGWAAFVQDNPECGYVDTTAYEEMRGPTRLVAEMRALVQWKFGDEVPDDVRRKS